jgi:hypothetical protein
MISLQLCHTSSKATAERIVQIQDNSEWHVANRIPGSNFLYLYRVALSRLTHFTFEYCACVIACQGWREGER